MDKEEIKLIEEYLKERGCIKKTGFRVMIEEMNPDDRDILYFEGKTMEEALSDYIIKAEEYWLYYEQVYEDINTALEFCEYYDGHFEEWKKKHGVKNV